MLQTGSGKTYTMGTGLREQGQTGLIPQVMTALFDKIDKLKHQAEYQLHVSFIEVCTIFQFKSAFACCMVTIHVYASLMDFSVSKL